MAATRSSLLSEDLEEVDLFLEEETRRHAKKKRLVRFGVAALAVAVVVIVIVSVAVVVTRHHAGGDNDDRPSGRRPNPVLLISVDGLRPDYLLRNDGQYAPNLNALANGGVRAEYMTPVFPSKTFPNHYSIVTGLYPESHGIISNTIFDPWFGETFTISNASCVTNAKWWWGEPVWVTAIKQGLLSAACFWPGSEAPIDNVRPTYYLQYNQAMPYQQRVDTVMNWLTLPEDQRPSFLCMYFEGVDSAGHSFGPDAPQTNEALTLVDTAIGSLLSQVAAVGLTDKLNIIVTSDHGMAEVSRSRVILLDDYITLSDVYVVEYGPNVQIIPNNASQAAEIVTRLTGAHPNMQAYIKELIPAPWFYTNNRRITPVLVTADVGWQVTYRAYFERYPTWGNGGTHGFNNTVWDMRATFLARGPDFRTNLTVPGFDNLHVYSLLCKLLGLTPAPNNGTLAAVADLLAA